MRRLALVLALVLLASPAAADAALWAALKEGGRVALIRHAATPGGAGDPPGFRLDDCATQRNLTEGGRLQARVLGDAIRRQGVPIAKVLSSQWCRCRDTADLMQLGPVELAPTFNNAAVLREQREALREGGREVISAWRGPGTLVVVTHGENIHALTGVRPAEGAIVVVAPDPTTKLRLLGQIAAPGGA